MSGEQVTALAVGLILAAGCAGEARRSHESGDGLVTVLSVFLAVWSVGLLLFSIPWIRYTHSSTEAWIAVYGSICAFVLGCRLARRRSEPGQRASAEEIDAGRLRWLWLACFGLGLVGLADFVYAVNAVLGWQSIFRDPMLVREIQTTSPKFQSLYGGLKLLTYFNQIAFLLWTVGLRERAFRGRWLTAAGVGWISMVPFLFTGDRTLIITGFLWALFFHLVWRPVARPRRLVAGLVMSLVIALGLFTLLGSRISATINNHPEIKAQLTTRTLDSLALPYVYLTANVPTLSQLMKDPIRPHTDGRMTLLPLVKLAHAVGIGGTPPEEVGAFYPIPFETFNTYTWLSAFYLDFGLIGCLILPLIIGFAFTRVTSSALRRRRLTLIWLSSLSLYVVAFSLVVNKLSTTLTWEYALLGPVAVVLLRRYPVPGVWLRAQWRRIRALPRAVRVVGVLAAAALASVVTIHVVNRRQMVPSPAALVRELRVAFVRASMTRRNGAFPSPSALASRLFVNDPAYAFTALGAPDQLPLAPGVIGVYTHQGSLTLRAFERGTVVQLGSPAPVLPASALGPGGTLLVNGDFDDGLRTGWQLANNAVASIVVSRKAMWQGHHALVVTGSGTMGVVGSSTVVEQFVGSLPSAAAGTTFDLALTARQVQLSRELAVEVKLLYTDGSYQFFDAHRLSGGVGRALGILPGGGQSWRRYAVTARAREPVSSIEVFAVDTGSRALTGAVYLSGLSLTERR